MTHDGTTGAGLPTVNSRQIFKKKSPININEGKDSHFETIKLLGLLQQSESDLYHTHKCGCTRNQPEQPASHFSTIITRVKLGEDVPPNAPGAKPKTDARIETIEQAKQVATIYVS